MSTNCDLMSNNLSQQFKAKSLLGKTSKGDQGMEIPINEQTSPMDAITVELAQRVSSNNCKAMSKG